MKDVEKHMEHMGLLLEHPRHDLDEWYLALADSLLAIDALVGNDIRNAITQFEGEAK